MHLPCLQIIFFFFQAEDGIRAATVTGVQTCGLPICITAEPCGRCSACEEIDGGRFVDLLEVDAATNTRVDEMRQLLDTAQYAPTRGRFKVYVIDEVHMLSNSAFNAILQ